VSVCECCSLLRRVGHEPGWIHDNSDVAIAFLTSGSTGTPRVVAHSLHMLFHQCTLANMMWPDLSPTSDRLTILTPVSHVLAWGNLAAGLASGVTLALPVGNHPSRLTGFLDDEGITCLKTTPSHLRRLVGAKREGRVKLDALRSVVLSGEACSEHLLNAARTVLPNVQLHEVYGSTEAPSILWRRVTEVDGNCESVSVGWPAPDTTVCLSRTGEILVSGLSTLRGYLCDDKLVPPESPFPMGDIARISSRGFVVSGRKDRIVKIRGGIRVQLEEIESAVVAHPEVREAAAVCVADSQGEGQLVCFCTSRSPGTTIREIQRFMVGKVHRSAIPQINLVEMLPRLKSGKVDLQRLQEYCKNASNPACPAEIAEKKIAEIWKRLLPPFAAFDADTTFREAGGDSLTFLTMLLEVERTFGFSLEECDVAISFSTLTKHVRDSLTRKQNRTDVDRCVRLSTCNVETLEDIDRMLVAQIECETSLFDFPLNATQTHRIRLDKLRCDRRTTFVVLRFSRPVVQEALTEALELTMARHAVFAEKISPTGAMQQLDVRARLRLPIVRTSENRLLDVERLCTAMTSLPLDLIRWPLFRIVLVQGPHEALFVLQLPHAICDLHGGNILQGEILSAYAAMIQNRRAVLPAVIGSPVEFASSLGTLELTSEDCGQVAVMLRRYSDRAKTAKGLLQGPRFSLCRLQKRIDTMLPASLRTDLLLGAYSMALGKTLSLAAVPLRIGTGGRCFDAFGRSFRRLVFQANDHYHVVVPTQSMDSAAESIRNQIQTIRQAGMSYEQHRSLLLDEKPPHVFSAGPLGELGSNADSENGVFGIPRPLWGVRTLYRSLNFTSARVSLFSYSQNGRMGIVVFSRGVAPRLLERLVREFRGQVALLEANILEDDPWRQRVAG